MQQQSTERRPGPRPKREAGSGTAPRWNPKAQRWELKVSLGDGTRRMLTHKTSQRELEKQRDQALRHVEHGIPTPTIRLTLGDFLDRWIKSVEIASCSGKPKRQT